MSTYTRTEITHILENAALASVQAPSVFNTQPWHWQISGDSMALFAEPNRQLGSSDPDGRLLLISCGAALHHARTVLAATGWSVSVERLPDPAMPKLLARVRLGHAVPADPEAQMMAAAIGRRRTDRRAYTDRPVAEATVTRLRRFVESEGVYLHQVRPDQMPMLAVATEHAAQAETGDPAYRAELREWTGRAAWRGDGVPPANAVAEAPRRVPVRDFAPEGHAGLVAGSDVDRGTAYVVVFGPSNLPIDLMHAGEALSALLLKATAEGLATEPLSDAMELAWTRSLMRELIAGVGEPYVAVRLGYVQGDLLPPTPRRDPAEVITIDN